RWPGHRPGKVVLGMSCGSVCQTREQQLRQEYGVHRQFRSWGNWRGVAKDIREDQAHGRLPWISVKGPNGGPSGWRAVASGRRDGAIRALARTLKAHDDKPVLITFHHEPSNDGTEAQGRLWARAYNRFHDVLKARGALRNVADPPILGEWLFNQRNKRQNPANWVTRGVLKRAPFLGVDLYENNSGETFAQRLPRVLRWMARRGFPHKMVGVGESAATSKRYAAKSAVRWINESLNWARRHPNRIGVVSYFNSTHNSRAKVYWPLDESPRKLRTFRRWLSDRVMVS
ncbi:MAG TPA: hypothetical protein VFJ14_06865, partial [Nocardioidaceae bacterium]|nr:hypothetical protein [Nocardioidaceae bacterium]